MNGSSRVDGELVANGRDAVDSCAIEPWEEQAMLLYWWLT